MDERPALVHALIPSWKQMGLATWFVPSIQSKRSARYWRRLRSSRRATSKDCEWLVVGKDVYVFTVHPQAHKRKAWYYARIVGVCKILHRCLQCKCSFLVQLFDIHQVVGTAGDLLDLASVRICIKQIRILEAAQDISTRGLPGQLSGGNTSSQQQEDELYSGRCLSSSTELGTASVCSTSIELCSDTNDQEPANGEGTWFSQPDALEEIVEDDSKDAAAPADREVIEISDNGSASFCSTSTEFCSDTSDQESMNGKGTCSDEDESQPLTPLDAESMKLKRKPRAKMNKVFKLDVESKKRKRKSQPKKNKVSKLDAEPRQLKPRTRKHKLFRARKNTLFKLDASKAKPRVTTTEKFFKWRVRNSTEDTDSEEDQLDIEQGYVVQLDKGPKASVLNSDDASEYAEVWQEMRLAFKSIKAANLEPRHEDVNPKQDPFGGCEVHDFQMEECVGLVCSVCGLMKIPVEKMCGVPSSTSYRFREKHIEEDKAEEEILEQQELQTISNYYKNFSLLEHQMTGVSFLKRNVMDEGGGCILAHSPGSGKSRTFIVFYLMYKEAHPTCKLLITTPKATRINWQLEFKKLDVNVPVHILKSVTDMKTLTSWYQEHSILVTTYNLAIALDRSRWSEQAASLISAADLVVFDEGHTLRGTHTKIRKFLNQLKTKKRILLSGTLYQNNFSELFNLLYLVRPAFITRLEGLEELAAFEDDDEEDYDQVASNRKAWKQGSNGTLESRALKLFSRQIGDKFHKLDAKAEDAEDAQRKLIQMTRSFLNYHQGGQILESLPGVHQYCVGFEPTPLQVDLMKQISRVRPGFEMDLASTYIGIHPCMLHTLAENFRKKIDHLLGAVKDLKNDYSAAPKLQFTMRLIYICGFQSDEKVLVFSEKLKAFELLVEQLETKFSWSLNNEIIMLTGRQSPQERQAAMDRFNDANDKSRVCLASIGACSEGIPLTGASRVVFLHTVWNASTMEQAKSRAFRPGQTRLVFVYRLYIKIDAEVMKNKRCNRKQWISTSIFGVENESKSRRTQAEILDEDPLLAKIGEDGDCPFEVTDHDVNDQPILT